MASHLPSGPSKSKSSMTNEPCRVVMSDQRAVITTPRNRCRTRRLRECKEEKVAASCLLPSSAIANQSAQRLAEEEYHGSKIYDNGLERAPNHYLEQRCPR
ncbi:jg23279 [Pararge aegeria aegeria]|uniref:Jg23279 protein n=1 Tax=Pararge aegeria aegeria TaxID=348720 RepID=A0A8S4SNH1_9NEOP|nr:jg23279 [Pararge aegeria aegeria]